ncbi:PB1 domain-containing protein [Artemisia annua]|uniref:PB1 domain-containing protein n=1 Tax=Artemisia annua TaxID=35608 RepID=A0A2U1Q347_ARTAN|nr:PB1 domain-containing protein [Artemisia annua]
MTQTTIKFLYSYNGKIMPRHDGMLRYIGGHSRVLSVDRSTKFAGLSVKFLEAVGYSVNIKCKLPNEDLDVLVSITNDEDLEAIVEEYERVCPGGKIRVLLFGVGSVKKMSPVRSAGPLVDFAMKRRTWVAWEQCPVVRVTGHKVYGFRPVVGVPLVCR